MKEQPTLILYTHPCSNNAHAFTVADPALAGSLAYADAGGLPVAEVPHLNRWWQALQARPAWRASAPPPAG